MNFREKLIRHTPRLRRCGWFRLRIEVHHQTVQVTLNKPYVHTDSTECNEDRVRHNTLSKTPISGSY